VALLTAGTAVLAADLRTELAEYDARVSAELRAIDAEAAKLFDEASAARATNDWTRATTLFRQVHERRPEFVHATRRLCTALVRSGKREEAVPLCREAAEKDGSPENLVALAEALTVTPPGNTPPTPDEIGEGRRIATSVLRDNPNNFFAATTVFQIAYSSQDLATAGWALERMEATHPEESASAFFRFLLSAAQGDVATAGAALERLRPSIPAAEYEQYKSAVDSTRSWTARLAEPAAWIVGGWIGGLVLLTLVGWILSRATLSAAAAMPPTIEGSERGASLRRIYRGVLAACCVYYYVSLPLVLLVVVVAGGEIVYGLIMLGHVPLKLLIVIVVAVAVTVFAMLRSLFVRAVDGDPGVRLDLEKHPEMRRVLDEVAGKIGTTAVSNVYLTPGTEVAVMERGGLTRRIAGQAERCLILGIGALEGMKLTPFKAILAHEYGHFSNRDTAGGGLAFSVRRSIFSMAEHLARGGAATWYNPAWWFLRGFHRLFLFISQGASRLQEILADRWAAFAYGSAAFEEGLRHVIEREVRFSAHVNDTVQDVVDKKRALTNLYTYRLEGRANDAAIVAQVEQALAHEPSVFDSHPSPQDRFRWVQALHASGEPSASTDPGAWSLFSDREALERAMTALVRANLKASAGIELLG
jgi:Zn-dependent protease with chaperone function